QTWTRAGSSRPHEREGPLSGRDRAARSQAQERGQERAQGSIATPRWPRRRCRETINQSVFHPSRHTARQPAEEIEMTMPHDDASRLKAKMQDTVRSHWKAFLIEGIILVI